MTNTNTNGAADTVLLDASRMARKASADLAFAVSRPARRREYLSSALANINAALARFEAEATAPNADSSNEHGAPNLDAMERDALMAFWTKHQRGRGYRELFPNGGRGSKRATADLANYASNLATARECRKHGDIIAATMYENIADRIYSNLAPFARW